METTLMDVPKVAKFLGTTEKHIRKLVFEKRIPYTKVGKLVRFNQDKIEKWLKAHEVNPAS
jgi:excisionase family DNA binding protein